jgi:hypothetical protein
MNSSERIDRNGMFVARTLAIKWETGEAEKVNQRRRGEFDTKEAESPGEELLSEIRNVIGTEAPEKEGEFGIAESKEELLAELVGSKRNCCKGRAVRNESVGTQENAGVAENEQEPWDCAD